MIDAYLPEGWTHDTIDDELDRQERERRANAATCSACGAPMIWAESASSGKRLPLNYDPDPKGNITIARHGERVVGTYIRKGDEPHASVPRYTSHFSNCPQANKFRRK